MFQSAMNVAARLNRSIANMGPLPECTACAHQREYRRSLAAAAVGLSTCQLLLLADDAVVHEASNLVRRVGSVSVVRRGTLAVDRAWENHWITFTNYLSAVQERDDEPVKLYYRVHGGWEAIALSDDGVNFSKPRLHTFPAGSRMPIAPSMHWHRTTPPTSTLLGPNNLVSDAVFNAFSVTADATYADTEAHYVAAGQCVDCSVPGRAAGTFGCMLTSRDGFRWAPQRCDRASVADEGAAQATPTDARRSLNYRVDGANRLRPDTSPAVYRHHAP